MFTTAVTLTLVTLLVLFFDSTALLLFGRKTVTILPYHEHLCHSLAFEQPFNQSEGIRIQLSYHQSGAPTYEAVVGWVEGVNFSGFEACVATSGPIRPSREVTVQWLAYEVVPDNGDEGIEEIPFWTTGTECVRVGLTRKAFTKHPYVFVTPLHTLVDRERDAAIIWVESTTSVGFDICLRELKNFDGIHTNIRVVWLALEDIPSTWKQIPFTNKVMFPNSQPLTGIWHYGFCQNVNFSQPFYAPPILITSASHRTDPQNPNTVYPKHNGITEWIEEIKTNSFTVCMKDLRNPMTHTTILLP